MPETFGARMREQRERQQVALSTIAEQTKIKVSLLEALEHDDVSHWPSGIFRRAFVRAYAHAIGLEPDAVLREFLELYPDPPEMCADALATLADDGRNGDAAPTRFKYLVASAIGSVSRLRARSVQKPEPVLQAVATMAHAADRSEPVSVESHVIVEEDPDTEAVSALGDDEPTVKMMLPVPKPEARAESAGAARSDSAPAVQSEYPAIVQSEPPAIVHPEPVIQSQVPTRSVESFDPDLLEVAHLCTDFSRVQTTADVPPLLQGMTKVLGAVGVIIWMWDPMANELRPALSHGYSDRVVAQLPRVERDTNNATAAAFRAERTCVVKGDEVDNGALAVPLIGPGDCFGVLTIELPDRREEKEVVRAHAMIFAAQLATLIGTAQPLEASDRHFANA